MSDLNYLAGIAIRNRVTAVCKTPISPANADYVNEVVFGHVRSDPKTSPVTIAVKPGNWDQRASRSGITKMDDYEEDMALDLVAREIGGPVKQFWYLHGVAEIECYYVTRKLTQAQAADAAYKVLGRTETAVASTSLEGTTDEFGKIAGKIFVYGRSFVESGVAPEIIWKGNVWWALHCQVPFE
jgi:hypothetical protein